MDNDQFKDYIETLQQQIAAMTGEQSAEDCSKSIAALEGLQLIHEEMQTNLESAQLEGALLFQQNQQLVQEYQQVFARYQRCLDLFDASPLAVLVTDKNGLILEANQAIARLLNLPQKFLVGKPLAVFVDPSERSGFRANLNRLVLVNEVQHWQLRLCSRYGEPFEAEFHIAIARDDFGAIKNLQIGVYDVSRYQKPLVQLTQQPNQAVVPDQATAVPTLPQSLDGLRVLIVDDEADIREFVTAIFEAHGIGVRTVASAAAALEALEEFRPNVLLSDIRMPDGDGYSLIRQIRALEREQGIHIPAAALTAYLEEDREKALNAGFEAHLHKLAQPTQWIEVVTQLARQSSRP